MALLRMTAAERSACAAAAVVRGVVVGGAVVLGAFALAACSIADADPVPSASRDSARPAGWKRLPSVAAAVGAAARGDGIAIDAVDAWGEPAIGCYAVWLTLHGRGGDARALADQVLASLAQASQASSAISISELALPTGVDGVLSFAFARTPYRGRVRAQLAAGRIALTTCFANQREPGACDAPCASVLRGAP
jgi:hypothetical protein